ncbi:MAG: TlpA disulfide reductase family protein [Acidobacteria bacterium]|jgi:peroxiredoxin|nr:TlpA disulfide reductase family protein [Acidobacteriota bacterium]
MAALQAGAQAADFSLPGMDEKQYSLAEALKQGPVLLAFFKSSCPVCQFTFPFLDRFYRHFRDTKAHIWAISQDDRGETREFINEYRLGMPVLLDDTRSYPTSNAYGIQVVPTVFLIGQPGDILHTAAGFQKQGLIQMGRKLEVLTGKKGFVPFREDDDVPDSRAG